MCSQEASPFRGPNPNPGFAPAVSLRPSIRDAVDADLCSGALPAAVAATGLCKTYGKMEAVRGVDFSVATGEVFGFLGPNGAGKSTTIAMLCTLLPPSGGTALVAGFDVVRQPSEVRRRIGLVFQESTLDEYLTAAENLRFHAELYGMPKAHVAPRLQAVLEMVGLWDRRGSLVRTFSGGMKRRLEIARGLLHSPRVLFLDEPTVGLDPQTRAHIWNYIEELRRREHVTIFLTTHYMDEAERCDRIAIMDGGRIVALDTPTVLKATVGSDRIELGTEHDQETSRQLQERFGVDPVITSEGVRFQAERGEELIPRLFADLQVPIRSVRLSRPSLDDVFMSYTGKTIRDADATAPVPAASRGWRRGRR